MKVLIATDGSTAAEEAAWLLAHLPHRQKLELTILSVVKPPDVHGSKVVVDWMERWKEAEQARATECCQRTASMFEGANASVDWQVLEGHVGKTILQESKLRNVDLIVIGAVGHSLLERITLGSVSDFVANHASCSVLVVRPTGLRERDHNELRLCIAYDGSIPARFAIEQLAQFDWQHHSKVHLVTILETPYTYMDQPLVMDPEPVRESLAQMNRQIAERVKSLAPSVKSHILDAMHVGDALVKFVEKHESDLLVLGDTGLGLVGDFLLGSAAKYVLRHADCSIWIARDPSRA